MSSGSRRTPPPVRQSVVSSTGNGVCVLVDCEQCAKSGARRARDKTCWLCHGTGKRAVNRETGEYLPVSRVPERERRGP